MASSSASLMTCSRRSASACTWSQGRLQFLVQVELEQAMVAQHFEGDAFAGRRQGDALIRLVVDQLQVRQLLDHVGGGGGRNVQVSGKCGIGDRRAL